MKKWYLYALLSHLQLPSKKNQNPKHKKRVKIYDNINVKITYKKYKDDSKRTEHFQKFIIQQLVPLGGGNAYNIQATK